MTTHQTVLIETPPEADSQASKESDLKEDHRPVDVDSCRAEVERVLSSAAFAKANRLYTFLDYVCNITLEGREEEISELNIGINVFERRKDYNASDDTIVRTTARLLRQRLKSYYETEGRADKVRIEIPRGAYVPTFLPITTEQDEPAAIQTPEPTPYLPLQDQSRHRTFASSLIWLITLLLVSAGLGAVVALAWLAPHRFLPWTRTPIEKLWALVFLSDRTTFLVPADTVLLMYEKRTHRLVPLDEYVGGNFMRPSDRNIPDLDIYMENYRDHRYTAVTSVEMAREFGQIPKAEHSQMQVRFARDLQTADLNQSNAILIGAAQNNPWVGLFRKELNFHIDWEPTGDRWRIRNDHPMASEPTEWPWDKADPAHTSYSHIALVHNLSGNGYALVLAGVGMFGTQAGSNFLLNPEKMNPLLKQALRKDGTLGTFEILLQSNVVANGTINSHVAAARFHP